MHPEAVAAVFDFGAPVVAVQPHGHGLINDTFVVTLAAGRRAILQRLNRRVFPRPERIMENLRTVLEHVRPPRTAAPSTRTFRLPDLYQAHDGHDFVTDAEGDAWRAAEFFEGTRSDDVITGAAQARETGFALGRLHALLHDLPPARLNETLPGFHVAPGYLERLTHAVETHGLADDAARSAYAFVAARRSLVDALEAPRRAGELPMRAIHGDPKLNNFLFDAATGRAVSLIDLDTVQPGLVHYDLGDCLRSCANRAGETAENLADVRFDLDIARALLEGYMAEARAFLTAPERARLYDAIRLLPFELGMRFLADHLEGDRYFKTEWRGQNLRRAQVQFRLTRSVEDKGGAIQELLRAL